MTKQTGQFGEYLVAAELCRRGFVATTFTRNMPGFDILALNEKNNKLCRIQVKTINKGEWSLDAKTYLTFDDTEFEKGVQKIISKRKIDDTDYTIFVKMDSYGNDKFYILSINELQEIVHKDYKQFLDSINGKRPKNPKTTHTAIHEEEIKKFEGNWEIID